MATPRPAKKYILPPLASAEQFSVPEWQRSHVFSDMIQQRACLEYNTQKQTNTLIILRSNLVPLVAPERQRSHVFPALLQQRACLVYNTQMQKIIFNYPAKHSSAGECCRFSSATTCIMEAMLCAPIRRMKTWKHHAEQQWIAEAIPTMCCFMFCMQKRTTTRIVCLQQNM